MKTIFFLLLNLTVAGAYAEVFNSSIHSMSEPDNKDKVIVRFENGRVGLLDSAIARHYKDSDSEFKAVLDDHSEVVALYETASRVVNDITPDLVQSYQPSVLESEEKAAEMVKTFRNPKRRWLQMNIQCYNLAHVRSYEAFEKHQLNSMKIFLFFSDKYIREYGSKWWFHVTPLTYIRKGGKVEARVLDPEWLKAPADIKSWTDHFIKSKQACTSMKKYSDYNDHQEEAHCYTHTVPMYYFTPRTLVELERTGAVRTEFDMGEVRFARRAEF